MYYFCTSGCGGTVITANHLLTAAHCVQGSIWLGHPLGGYDPEEIRIINGEQANPGQFPWQTWIESVMYYFSMSGCGGTLITTNHLLTAAHCVQGVLFFRVRLGAVNRLSNQGVSSFVPGYRATAHPGYTNAGYTDDIAVIALLNVINPTATIQPIKLPEPWEMGENLSGKTAIVSGFGKISDTKSTANPTLQYARLRILEPSLCTAFYKDSFDILIQNSQICTVATDAKSNVCSGDSGGPLIINDSSSVPTLVGVVSLGVQPCESGSPSVYTAVAKYLPWINEIIK